MSAVSPTVSNTRERLARHFFRNFFRLLLVAVAIGEWACLAHLLQAAYGRVPAWGHVAGPLAFYAINLLIVRVSPTTPIVWRRNVLQAYSAFAFAAVFGFVFLILNALLWGGIALLTQSVSLAAGDQAANVASLPSIAYDWTSTGGLLVIGFSFLYGYTIGQRRMAITGLLLPFRRATAPLAGVRIVQISDIHIGRYMQPETLAGYVEQVNQLKPDILVITGDILDSLSAIPEGFPVLSRLQAKYGVFATLGNHDFYAGADEVAAALRRMTNFTVLRDDFATVHINGAALHIAGVDDMGRDWARGVTFHPGLAKILPRLSPDVPVVLLSHRPDLFPHAVAAGVELVLSGHTHGGQLSLPSLGRRPISIARFITRYDRGLYREASSYVYVNRGLGCTGQRVRLFTPRDISIVEIEVPGERV